jgi:hypothetical protein
MCRGPTLQRMARNLRAWASSYRTPTPFSSSRSTPNTGTSFSEIAPRKNPRKAGMSGTLNPNSSASIGKATYVSVLCFTSAGISSPETEFPQYGRRKLWVVVPAIGGNIAISLINTPEPSKRRPPDTSEGTPGRSTSVNRSGEECLHYAGWACISATTASRWVSVSSMVSEYISRPRPSPASSALFR